MKKIFLIALAIISFGGFVYAIIQLASNGLASSSNSILILMISTLLTSIAALMEIRKIKRES